MIKLNAVGAKTVCYSFGFLSEKDQMEKTNDSERRGHERFIAKKGTMAFCNVFGPFGQVADISPGGLAVLYFRKERSPHFQPLTQREGLVEVVYGKKDLWFGKVKVDVISNILLESARYSGSMVSKWRGSLKFKELTSEQLFLLKRLLLKCTERQSFYQ